MNTRDFSKKEYIIGDQLIKNHHGNIKINMFFNDFEKALRNSKQAWGLDHFGPNVIDKKKLHAENAKNLFPYDDREFRYILTEDGEIWYVNDLNILKCFSWFSALTNSLAAIVFIDVHGVYGSPRIYFSEYKYNRDDLRGTGIVWTID